VESTGATPTGSASLSPESFTLWFQNDPHVGAYAALFSPLGKQIGQRLGMADVSKEPRCVACHATTQVDAPWEGAQEDRRLFGVGCESCHGKASGWIQAHQTRAWNPEDPQKKATLQKNAGMVSSLNLAKRVETCAGCHVGAPADPANGLPLRDVDHDFLAAGHPRLLFEFTSFLSNLPRHFSDPFPSIPGGESEAWKTGQLVLAKAGLELSQSREKRAEVQPELAEWDCQACHHPLSTPSPGVSPKTIPRRNRWSYTMLPLLLEKETPWAQWDHELMAPSSPDSGRITETLLARVNEELAKRDSSRGDKSGIDPKSRLARLSSLGKDAVSGGWDETEQVALAWRAHLAHEARTHPSPANQKKRESLDTILSLLAFPPGHSTAPQILSDPSKRKQLRELLRTLGP